MKPGRRTLPLLICALAGAALPLVVSCGVSGPPPAEEPTLQLDHVMWAGVERLFATYEPATFVSGAPMVLLLHGGFGSAAGFWETELVQCWRALADEEGFLLVLPEGAPDAGGSEGHHWNDCRVDTGDLDSMSAADDVGFIDHVVDVVSSRFSTDPDRVYVAGASNGGMMTFRLAMQLEEHFAAVAAIISNLPDPSECAWSAAPLPILIMNGTADPLMPYNGGCVLGPGCRRGSVRSTAATVAFWVSADGAVTTPSRVDLPDLDPSDGSTVAVYRFGGVGSDHDVVLYRVEGGGHCAPGCGALPADGQNRDIDAATEIWSFFRQHVRGV